MDKPNRIEQIVRQYRDRLTEILGEELEFVVLYGSQARGDAIEGSDIDVLCVMRRPFDYGTLVQRTAETAAQIRLKYDVVISTAFLVSEDYQARNTPFLMSDESIASRRWPAKGSHWAVGGARNRAVKRGVAEEMDACTPTRRDARELSRNENSSIRAR
jgi:predicted nucleotidyltransferase